MMRKLLSTIIALILLFISLLVFVASTHSGLTLLLRTLPGEVSYSELNGTLLTTLQVKNFSYQSDTLSLKINEASVTAKLGLLLKKQLNIKSLQADKISLSINDKIQNKNSTKKNNDVFGFNLSLNNIQVNQFTLHSKEKEYTINDIKLSLQKKNTTATLNQLHLLIYGQAIEAEGSVKLTNNYKTTANLFIHSLAENNQTALHLNGDINKWNLNAKTNNKQTIALSGTGSPLTPSQLKWDIRISSLSEMIPNASGSLESSGEWLLHKSPSIEATLTADHLKWNTLAIKQLSAQAHTNVSHIITATLNSNTLEAAGYLIQKFNLDFEGTTQQHQINTEISIPNGTAINMTATGSYENKQWQASVDKLLLSLPEFGTLNAATKNKVTISPKAISFTPLCLTHANGQICTDFNSQANHWQFKFNSTNLPLSILGVAIPDQFNLKGSINSNLNLSYDGNKYRGKMDATLTPGSVHYNLNGETHVIAYDTSTFAANLDNQGLLLSSSLLLKDQGTATVKLSLPDYKGEGIPTFQQRVIGNTHVNIHSLEALEFISPALDKPTGEIAINGDMKGTLAKPLFNFKATLAKGQVTIIPAGITITDINVLLHAENNNRIALAISGNSGEQTLKINGAITPRGLSFPMQAHIAGDNIKVMDTPEYKIFVSPDVNIKLENYHLSLDGKIDSPSINFAPKDFSSIATLPPDTVYIDANEIVIKEKKSPWQIDTDLTFNAKKINFNFRGLNASLKGAINIQGNAKSPMNTLGNLEIIKGTYSAYGQNLTIMPGGFLLFNGEVANPQLNLKANRTIALDLTQTNIPTYEHNLIAGIQVTGTLQEPKITLYSNIPSLSQQDILSYLIFGFAPDQLNNSQSTMLWQALSALGSGDSGPNLTNKLKQTFGLNELGFESTTGYNSETGETETGTAFVVGKQLSKRLSASYSVGLVIPVNTLYLRYQLGRRWAFQTDSSTLGNGADIIYSISRD